MQLKGIIRLISQISRVSQVSRKYVFADDKTVYSSSRDQAMYAMSSSSRESGGGRGGFITHMLLSSQH